MEAVEARHHLRGIERPQAAVEPVSQGLAGLQVARRESRGERHPAGLERPLERVALDLERAVRRAEVARSDARGTVSQRGERDVGRDALPRRQQPRRQGPRRGVLQRRPRPVPRGHVDRARTVGADRVAQRTDQHAAVHDLRQPRHVLADGDPRRRRGDRAELAADLLGGVGLEVPHVDRRRTPGEPDLDHPGRRFLHPGVRRVRGLGPQRVGQAHSQQPGHADPQDVAAVEPLAVGPCSRHRGALPRSSARFSGSARIRAC